MKKFSWKDLFTTAIAIVIGVVLVAKIRDYDWAFIGSWRTAVASTGFLGLLMATFDEEDFTHFNTWGAVEWTLALAGVGLVVAGLIVASEVLFVILAADVLILWVASVIRHAFSRETTVHGRFPALRL
ncbi:hypothetical protein COU91_01250 [Candidatus Saccharibacteria bacterium CG10_big_fil_rev_8_21_14_0_10_47_8]|nr:MAG: hypothetical protein COU91_01250 [Candidatus Saccharibacteria bacterium CG10_big_fil_rev_8_21_14_0_10_47_8]